MLRLADESGNQKRGTGEASQEFYIQRVLCMHHLMPYGTRTMLLTSMPSYKLECSLYSHEHFRVEGGIFVTAIFALVPILAGLRIDTQAAAVGVDSDVIGIHRVVE